MNLADLRRTLGVDSDGGCGMGNSTMGHTSEADDDGLYGADSKARQRRLSMERMDLLKVCSLLLFPRLFLNPASLEERDLTIYVKLGFLILLTTPEIRAFPCFATQSLIF